jgi:hypothetical protein
LSTLQGSGLLSFYEPLTPQVNIVVECEPEDLCDRYAQVLDDCSCPF